MILFLAANPRDTGRLALDQQARAIHLELKRSGYRDRFEFVTRWAAEPLDLLRELRELKPTIVHFSGHGARSAGTLVFDGAEGSGQVVTPEAFVQTLAAAGPQVRLVVLNACFTEPMARSLLGQVDCVVGMTGAIHDDAARNFAIGFYGGLGERESIAAAFAQGTAAINLSGLPDADRPQLQVRDGFDASALVLAGLAPTRAVKLPCPYPGMRPYQADDAEGFHGRDSEVEELIGRLRAGEREIYVIGPSGSGKSSLVAAGLLRQLARGVSGLGPFVVRTMRPGERPAARLCEALDAPEQPLVAADQVAALLAHRGPSSQVLLVVDQLEELFTLASAGERASFLAALRELRAVPRWAMICTLRADFFGALIESSLWPEHRSLAQLSHVEVSPLRGEALREAIAAPAHEIGVEVEPELVERLLADAASEPGILPLLQETLVELWDKRTDQVLTLADYVALGDGERSGLAVALARRADATLRRFHAAQADIARRILLRLISFGEGRSDTRRQQPRAQLCAGEDAAEFARVLQAMVDDRLLTVDDDIVGETRVDLAHEAMISAWPSLAGWIRNHRVDELRRRRLEEAAVQYGRGARGLLDRIELAEAEKWQRTESAIQIGQSAQVLAFIATSRATQTRQRRLRGVIVLGAVGFATISTAMISVESQTARNQAKNALSQANIARVEKDRATASRSESKQRLAQLFEELGRQELVEKDHPEEAIPYFLEARRNGLDTPALRMMFGAASRQLPVVPALAHQGVVVSAAFSPDGTRVVTASSDRTARVWNAATGQPVTGPLAHDGIVVSAAFSPDGTRVVTASTDHTARVWNAATGQPVARLAHQDTVVTAAFSPDGTRVVTASSDRTARVWDAATGEPITRPFAHRASVVSAAFSPDRTRVVTASWDHTARVWDAATGQPISRPLAHRDSVTSAAFSPDGRRLVTTSWDRTARVWDATTGQPIASLVAHDIVMSAAFSPDGRRVVTASRDRTARVWDAATGKPITGPLAHHDSVVSVAFSPDGTRVVTASNDHTARVWDAATGSPVTRPLEHQARVRSAAFSSDGTHVVTASDDHTARVWDAATDPPVTRLLALPAGVAHAAFSPDLARAVLLSDDGTARVWDAATDRPVGRPLAHRATVRSIAFSPDGTRVVTASWDHTARVWDAATGQPVGRPLAHENMVEDAAFSPDGARVVTASWDHTARVWDAATGQPIARPFADESSVERAAFSPDGTRVVTATWRTARVWDAATGQPVTDPLVHLGSVTRAAFSPDGTRVVTASDDRTARVWDAATGQPVTGPLVHQASVESAAFSPDGTRVVTASYDDTARVWNAVTGQPVTNPLVHPSMVLSAAFSPDGTLVVTASWDGTVRVWDACTGEPISHLLEHARNVGSAAFRPDGTLVITASEGHTAGVWRHPLDPGTIEQWAAVAERSPFVLNGIAVTLASAAQASTSASTPTELDDLALRLLEGLPPPPPLPE